MTFPTLSYLQFLWHSKNEHAVHSPFVFSLLTKCFYDRKPKPAYSFLNASLGENEKLRFNSLLSQKNGQFLYRLHSYFESKQTLVSEATDTLAILALATSSATNKIKVIAATPSATLQEIVAAESELDFTATSLEEAIPASGNELFDFIYFDNYSDSKKLLEDYITAQPSITNDSVWVFNNLHQNKDKKETWEAIKQRAEVSVTVDTYHFQLVFFRREQPKEHFIIRQ
ncbi:hypothetical protein [Flavobacterium frigidarium]|uniref:hypothetical protein n=1 Tax=Flavobacterium frigidarium TaxID=99286 RepID=UPI00047DFAB2|nr:hypothetical protein [Flavobacterium frigidarium]